MATRIKTRIVPHKDLGAPPRGYIYGKVDRLVKRKDPTGNPYGGFGGIFEASPYDEKYPPVQAATLFLPDAAAELIRKPFSVLKAKNGDATLVFRFGVESIKTEKGNALKFTPIGDFVPADPLSDVRAGLPARPKKGAKRS